LFERHAATLGLGDPMVYLADLQQAVLVPFVVPSGPLDSDDSQCLGIDSTLAGRAFQRVEPVLEQAGPPDGEVRVWAPLVNGTERLGVLVVTVPARVTVEAPGSVLMTRIKRFASLAAELVMTKSLSGDTIVRLRRRAEMGLAAEMQWSLLPPLTFASMSVTVAGGLEPAYEVGGDSIDYAVDAGVTKFAIFDGMGHGLSSAHLATLIVAAYRNGRRSNRSLTALVRIIDEAVVSTYGGEMFATAVIAELDTESGLLSWVNVGHPEPLLLRDGRLIKLLHVDPTLPVGLDLNPEESGPEITVGTESLQRGDLVVIYTDGVVEARSPEGDFFGQDRLVDLLTRHLAADLPAPESMRRIIHALMKHHQGQLADDATMLFVQWCPEGTEALVP